MTERVILFADGGSRGNPGPSGSGAVIKAADGKVLAEVDAFIGHTSNNVAEYTGLLIGLKKAIELGYKQIEVRMDSQLVVRQIMGQYKVKNEKLIPLHREAVELSRRFSDFQINHIPRELNKEADILANKAMDRGG